MRNKQITVPLFIPHRGCPHHCIFCNQWTVSNTGTIPDKETVTGTIERYLSTGSGASRIEVAFFGGTFTGLPLEEQEQFLSWIRPYREQGAIQGIRLSTRPDYISHEILDLLERYLVDTIELGVQSFHDHILQKSRRGHSVNDVYTAVDLIKSRSCNFVIQLMPGLPGDTAETSLSSARMAAELAPSGVRLYPAVVLKKTAMERLYRSGAYRPLTLEQAVDLCKDLYAIFHDHAIPVIRTGLHPFDAEQRSMILAGPYHPSFGFLVKSRVKRALLEKDVARFIDSLRPGKSRLLIRLPFHEKEEYIGMKKENILYLRDRFKLEEIRYHAEKRDNLCIEPLW